jgi:folate-binding protein YgfZ
MSSEITAIAPISGWFNRSARVRLEISGPDRAKFLHNLTTNDVKRLPVGQGQESFVTTLQGKTLAYVDLLATETVLLLRTETATLEGLAPHLAKYGVFDDVVIDDVSASTFEIHLTGPEIGKFVGPALLESLPQGLLSHAMGNLDGVTLRVVRESPMGPSGLTLIGPINDYEAVKQRLAKAELNEIDGATFDALRIEAGTPLSGRDVTLANLPQEVARDSKTINFVKGCYLGQETVARLDALGHVNRLLKGLTIEGSKVVPPDGTPLTFDGKTVGTITSAAFSNDRGCIVALGYVKVAQASTGTRLNVAGDDGGEAIVRES